MSTEKPGLEVLTHPHPCDNCGGDTVLTEPAYCDACVERALEQARRDRQHARNRDDELRRKEWAVILQLRDVRDRTRQYLDSKAAPPQFVCVDCGGKGGDCPYCVGGVIQ